MQSLVSPPLTLEWVTHFTDSSEAAIIALVNYSTLDDGVLGFAEPLTEAQTEAFLHRLSLQMRAGDSHVLLGQMNGKPACMAILSVNRMPNCAHRGELSKGIVHPDFRGRHLVPRCLNALANKASDLGIEQLVLDVREDSRAHRLWARVGFVTYGVLEDYARLNGHSYRGHLMVHRVSALRSRLATP